MRRQLERGLVTALCLAIGWFYVWTVRSSGDPWNFGQEQRDYYNLLIDGYFDGQLHMKIEVPEALLKLKDPYDPGERPPGLGLHDASFYKGKYYVYFGAAPMVTLMLPFRLLTGTDLPQAVAVLVFIYAGFLASVAVWLAVRRRYFPETGMMVILLGVLVLGLAGVGPVLLRRPHMWELPIGGGYCFAMLTLGCVWRSLHVKRGEGGPPSGKARAWWFAGAGLCLGLAIASRPTYLIASPFLVVPLLWWWRSERRVPWRVALSAAAPLAFVGSLMAWHNYARFENPLQFGQAYQLSLDYESKLPHFRGAYMPFTVRAHFFSGAQWSRYFPFIQRADLGEAPAGFTIHRGDIYGILTNFPITWLAFLVPLAWWRQPKEERGPLGAWLATTFLLFALPAVMLLLFFSALARYQMDFAPALMLLVCVGLLAVERWLRMTGCCAWRWSLRAGWMIAAGFSVLFGVLYSLQFDGLLGERNPRLERDVARALNRWPAAVERWLGVIHGPVELKVQFPVGRLANRREVLLTSGQFPRVDRVFALYRDDGRVQLGVAPFGGIERLSRPIAAGTEMPHVLHVTLGSFYPPETHPFFSDGGRSDGTSLARRGRIDFDGETVVDGIERFTAAANEVKTGDEIVPLAGYDRFSGRILSVARTSAEKVEQTEIALHFVRLRLNFPSADRPESEPLLSAGSAAGGVVFCMRNAGDGRVVWGWRTASGESGESDPMMLDRSIAHDVVIQLFRGVGERRRLARLTVGDVIVFSREFETTAIDPVVGKNAIGAAACAPEFTGVIHSVDQSRGGIDPLQARSGAIKLRVVLPGNRRGEREPLVVAGRPGSADQFLVEYGEGQTVRFALDHWGHPLAMSAPIAVDYGQPHEIEVRMSSLFERVPGLPERATRPGFIRVTLDGRIVWQHTGFFFATRHDEIAVGRNSAGGTASGPRFTGSVLAAERITP